MITTSNVGKSDRNKSIYVTKEICNFMKGLDCRQSRKSGGTYGRKSI